MRVMQAPSAMGASQATECTLHCATAIPALTHNPGAGGVEVHLLADAYSEA